MIIDPISLVIALVLAAFAGIISLSLKSTYAKYSQVPVYSGLTGAQIARRIMASEGVNDVELEEVPGEMSDHYDPTHKVVGVSPHVYQGNSIASQAIAAHEIGHVIQHARGYAPLMLRTYIAPVCAFGSNLAPWIIVLGLMLSMPGLAQIGVWLFAAFVFFTVLTLPVEFDASKRALRALADGRVMTEEELYGAKKVLNAAAMTYVAAAVASITWLLYYLLILSGQQRD